jgi:hypothetical protein
LGGLALSIALVAGTGTQTYTYGYLPNSDLLETLTTSHGLTVSRTYEPQRDVLTHVQNQFGATTISQYDYISDEFAQRTSMTTSGTAFEPTGNPAFGYGDNAHAEMIAAQPAAMPRTAAAMGIMGSMTGPI